MKYLMCGLNGDDYAYPDFGVSKKESYALHDAMKEVIAFGEFPEIKVECVNNAKTRVTGDYEDGNFYVAEIFRIDETKGDSLLIWHHGYEGVDFEIKLQGTKEECEKEYEKLLDEYKEEYDDICDNVVDTGSEWEVLSIVSISELDQKNISSKKANAKVISEMKCELEAAYDGLNEYAEKLEDSSVCGDHLDNLVTLIEKLK